MQKKIIDKFKLQNLKINLEKVDHNIQKAKKLQNDLFKDLIVKSAKNHDQIFKQNCSLKGNNSKCESLAISEIYHLLHQGLSIAISNLLFIQCSKPSSWTCRNSERRRSWSTSMKTNRKSNKASTRKLYKPNGDSRNSMKSPSRTRFFLY